MRLMNNSNHIFKIYFLFLTILILFDVNLSMAAPSENITDRKLEFLSQAEENFNNAEMQEDGSYNVDISSTDPILLGTMFAIGRPQPRLHNLVVETPQRYLWNANYYSEVRIQSLFTNLDYLIKEEGNSVRVTLVLKTIKGRLDLEQSFFSFRSNTTGKFKYSFYELFKVEGNGLSSFFLKMRRYIADVFFRGL